MRPDKNTERMGRAGRLNTLCKCVTLEPRRLKKALIEETGNDGLAALVMERASSMFSNVAVFVSSSMLAEMSEAVSAILRVTANPSYRREALGRASPIARIGHGPAGVFMGFDFHLTAGGPRLIEVNTNAGGVFLNAVLGRAHRACCSRLDASFGAPGNVSFDARILSMFESEWRLQRSFGVPGLIAIVDDEPPQQALYPEFLLAQSLLKRNGFEAVIAAPEEIAVEQGILTIGGRRIDLVYNRMVDFDLSDPVHRALREAYEMGGAVVTPNPYNHALHADKRNLVLLSDVANLREWGVAPHDITTLSKTIPRAYEVTPQNAETFWRDRKLYFFKPFAGYASKAVYRGDKLTSARWAEIRTGGYIAQEFAAPGERIVSLDGQAQARKVDIRLYTYGSDILLSAARLYQGQTTNMRTPGGGFSPLLVVDGLGEGIALHCGTGEQGNKEECR